MDDFTEDYLNLMLDEKESFSIIGSSNVYEEESFSIIDDIAPNKKGSYQHIYFNNTNASTTNINIY